MVSKIDSSNDWMIELYSLLGGGRRRGEEGEGGSFPPLHTETYTFFYLLTTKVLNSLTKVMQSYYATQGVLLPRGFHSELFTHKGHAELRIKH